RVIQVVCHARGQYAHGMHPLFVQERLALALQLALSLRLRGDVVDHGDRLATLQALEPHLDDLPLALEPRQVGNRCQGRRLAANQLREARIPHPRMGSAEPAPRSPAGVQSDEARVRIAASVPADVCKRRAPGRFSPSRERVARRGGGGHAGTCVLCVSIGSRQAARSRKTRAAALCPAAPITEPAGWQPALHEYTPSTGVAYGRRSANPKELSTWWMWPREIPKCCSIFGGVRGKASATSAEVPGAKRSQMWRRWRTYRDSSASQLVPESAYGTHCTKSAELWCPCASRREGSSVVWTYDSMV